MKTSRTINTQYDLQADNFLKQTGTEIRVSFLCFDHPHWVKESEKPNTIKSPIYNVCIQNKNGKYQFKFHDSVVNTIEILKNKSKSDKEKFSFINNMNFHTKTFAKYTNEFGFFEGINPPLNLYPSNYSILACLNVYDIENFEGFCSEFGYDTDSITAEKTFKEVQKEQIELKKIFTQEQIELLNEIQ